MSTRKMLFISGNPSLDSFKGIVTKYLEKYPEIEHIYVIDNPKSIVDIDGNSILVDREHFLNSIKTKGITISSSLIKDNENYILDFPKIILDQIKIYGKTGIFIDVTSGKKFHSSLFYTIGVLLRIPNICYVERDSNLIREFPRFDDIASLKNEGKFELIYYLEKKDEVFSNVTEKVEKILGDKLISIDSDLDSAIETYFQKDYVNSVSNSGKVNEATAMCFMELLKKHTKEYKENKEFDISNCKSFSDCINRIRTIIKPIKEIRNQDKLSKLDEDSKELLKLLTIPEHLNITRIYRNKSAHPYSPNVIEISEKEAKQCLNSAFICFSTLIDFITMKYE